MGYSRASRRHYDRGLSSEWYTPANVIEAARRCMGAIDLDPASCEAAQRTVQAALYFDRTQDGLRRPWCGRVWLNPPYSDYPGQASQWVSHAVDEFEAGRIEQLCLLVNLSVVYQQPMQRLARLGSLCIVDHRLRFVDAAGQVQRSPTQANVIGYLGERRPAFAGEFGRFGVVLVAGPRVAQNGAEWHIFDAEAAAGD